MVAYAEAKALYDQAEDVIEGMLISVDEPYWNSSVAAAQSQTYLQHFELVTEAEMCPELSAFWNASADEPSLGLSKIERHSRRPNQNRQRRWKPTLLVSKLD